MAFRVDAHHHVWHYSVAEFGWLEGTLEELRRDFLPEQLSVAMRSAEVAGALAVQARQSVEETDWLLALAAASPEMLGVVGWLPIAAPEFGALLDRYQEETWLKGLRHVVQAEPDGFLDDPAFNQGIDLLTSTGLVYDLLVYERQMDEVMGFVDRHPNQRFVLDHLGKPRIAAGEREPWASNMRELARRSNVTCKISGMVTEADPVRWTEKDLKPYFDVALEAFTPARLMVGTDWPVLTVACTYERWWAMVGGWAGGLSHDEQDDLFGGVCLRTYRLALPVDDR